MKLQDAAFHRVHHTGKIVLSGHLVDKVLHLPDGVLACLHLLTFDLRHIDRAAALVALYFIHFLIRDRDQIAQPVGLVDHLMHMPHRHANTDIFINIGP